MNNSDLSTQVTTTTVNAWQHPSAFSPSMNNSDLSTHKYTRQYTKAHTAIAPRYHPNITRDYHALQPPHGGHLAAQQWKISYLHNFLPHLSSTIFAQKYPQYCQKQQLYLRHYLQNTVRPHDETIPISPIECPKSVTTLFNASRDWASAREICVRSLVKVMYFE